MIPPYTYAAGRLAEERTRDVLREGEHARLMRMARPIRRGHMDRLLARVGRVLVWSGEQLRARCEPVQASLGESTMRVSR